MVFLPGYYYFLECNKHKLTVGRCLQSFLSLYSHSLLLTLVSVQLCVPFYLMRLWFQILFRVFMISFCLTVVSMVCFFLCLFCSTTDFVCSHFFAIVSKRKMCIIYVISGNHTDFFSLRHHFFPLFFSVLSFSTPPSLTTLNSFTFCHSFMSICSWFCFQFGLLKVVRSALKVCLSEFPSQQSLFLARQWQIAFYRLSPYSLQPSSFLEEKKRHIRHTIFNYENITGRIEWNTWDAIASGRYEKKFEKDRETSREKMRVSKHSPMTLTIVYSRHCRNWYKWGKNGHFFVDRVKLDFT